MDNNLKPLVPSADRVGFQDSVANDDFRLAEFQLGIESAANDTGQGLTGPMAISHRTSHFPFIFGRCGRHGSVAAKEIGTLLLVDTEPFNVSHHHCSIEKSERGLHVLDCHSTLGTWVNGERIGSRLPNQLVQLREGENEIVLGSSHSRHVFRLSVQRLNSVPDVHPSAEDAVSSAENEPIAISPRQEQEIPADMLEPVNLVSDPICVLCPSCGSPLKLRRKYLGVNGQCIYCQEGLVAIEKPNVGVVVELLSGIAN